MKSLLVVALLVGLVLLTRPFIGSKVEASPPEWITFTNICAFVTEPNGHVVIHNGVETMSVRFHNGAADKVAFGGGAVQPIADINILPEPCLFVP